MQDDMPRIRVDKAVQYNKELKKLGKKYKSIDKDTDPLSS